MVKMGNVWDRASAVLNARAAVLAAVAIPTLWLPGVVRAALTAYVVPDVTAGGGRAVAIALALVSLALAVVSVWGQLALIAIATDPAITRSAAARRATARLLPAVGIALLLLIALLVILIPPIAAVARADIDWAGVSAGTVRPAIAPGVAVFIGVYGLLVGIVLLFVGPRLMPLHAVVLHEARGIGAVRRSWALTRRHTWRLIGVLLLFGIVLSVAVGAAQSVTGVIVRLILGPDGIATATFVAAIVAGAVSTALAVAAVVFTGQLYLALVARDNRLAQRAQGQA